MAEHDSKAHPTDGNAVSGGLLGDEKASHQVRLKRDQLSDERQALLRESGSEQFSSPADGPFVGTKDNPRVALAKMLEPEPLFRFRKRGGRSK